MTYKMFPKHKYSNNGIIPVAKTSNNLFYNKVLKKKQNIIHEQDGCFSLFQYLCRILKDSSSQLS